MGIKVLLKKRVVIPLLAAAVAAGVYFYRQNDKLDESITAPIQREYTAAVGSITVGVEGEGSVSAQVAELEFDYDATVQEVHVAPGQRVSAGDPLITLSADSIRTAIKEKQLEVQTASVSLSKTKTDNESQKLKAYSDYQTALTYSGTVQEQYDMSADALQQDIYYLEDKVDNLEDERDDIKELREDAYQDHGRDSDEYIEIDAQYDEINKQYQDASDELQNLYLEFDRKMISYQYELDSKTLSAKNAYAVYTNTLSTLDLNLTRAQQDLETLNEELGELNILLEDSVLKAPADGIVLTVDCEVGDVIKQSSSSSNSNSTPKVLASIMKLETMTISSAIAQEDIISLEMGHEVMITLDMYEDTPLTGYVSAINLSPVSSGGNVAYTVDVSFQPGELVVYDGMTAALNFIIKQKNDVLYIQSRAIINENGKQYVNIKNEDGTTTKTQVTTGFSDGRVVEILSGMAEGQTAVSEG